MTSRSYFVVLGQRVRGLQFFELSDGDASHHLPELQADKPTYHTSLPDANCFEATQLSDRLMGVSRFSGKGGLFLLDLSVLDAIVRRGKSVALDEDDRLGGEEQKDLRERLVLPFAIGEEASGDIFYRCCNVSSFSPTLCLVATACGDGTVRVWDWGGEESILSEAKSAWRGGAGTGKEVTTMLMEGKDKGRVCVCRDVPFLGSPAVCGGGSSLCEVRCWDVETGSVISALDSSVLTCDQYAMDVDELHKWIVSTSCTGKQIIAWDPRAASPLQKSGFPLNIKASGCVQAFCCVQSDHSSWVCSSGNGKLQNFDPRNVSSAVWTVSPIVGAQGGWSGVFTVAAASSDGTKRIGIVEGRGSSVVDLRTGKILTTRSETSGLGGGFAASIEDGGGGFGSLAVRSRVLVSEGTLEFAQRTQFIMDDFVGVFASRVSVRGGKTFRLPLAMLLA